MRNLNKKLVIGLLVFVMIIAAIITAIIVINRKSNVSKEKSSLEAAKAELEDYKFSEHANLEFSCQPLSIDADELYQFETGDIWAAGDTEKDSLEEMLETYSGKDIDRNDITYEYDNYAWYDAEPFHANFHVSKTFLLKNHDETDKIDYENAYSYKKINAMTEDYSNEVYPVSGENLNVKETADFCTKYINDNFSKYFNDDEELVLSDILVIKNGNEENDLGYYYVFRYQHKFKGLLVNDSGMPTMDSKFIRPGFVEATVTGKNTIAHLENRYYYHVSKCEKIKGDIIPLSKAENILADFLAPLTTYNVSEVALKYVCIDEMTADNLIYRPMWTFTLQDYDWDKVDHVPSLTAAVDAQTGQVFVYDSLKCYFYESELEAKT